MAKKLLTKGAKIYLFILITLISLIGVFFIYDYRNNLDTGKAFFTKETSDDIFRLHFNEKIDLISSDREMYIDLLSRELDYEPQECNKFIVKRFHDACYMDFVVLNPLNYSNLCEEIEDINIRSACNVMVNNALYFMKKKV